MKPVWTWGGKFFGHIDGEDLWTYDGKHVGKLNGNEIYGREGQYLGEVMNGDRLITNNAKRSARGYSFTPYGRRGGFVPYTNYVGYVMYAGHQDFPGPDEF